jgi:hypothetical protein
MVYWRAWVDEQHVAQYRDDIYQLPPVEPVSLFSHKVTSKGIVQ